jgi:uncharacterized repeat protein (TIGR02543 family)
MITKTLSNNKRVLMTAIAAILLFACFMPTQIASASTGDIIGVDGRIIPKDKTGDTSAWIEIAKFDGYSLIIRQEPLTSRPIQFRTDLVYNNQYTFSTVRRDINNWYNYTLSKTARLRDFAVTSNAMGHWGSYGTDYVDGISRPLGVAAPKGDDIAFALSFCESAFFCSTQYIKNWNTGTLESSPYIASKNYLKLLPKYVNGGATPAFWLRTPGTSYTLAGIVAFQGQPSGTPIEVVMGRTNQHNVTGVFGHYRPAMWVGDGIFGGLTVKYEPNGGIGSTITDSVTANTYYTIRNNSFQPPNSSLQFDSWNTMANGTGVRYTAAQVVYLTTSLTLYAQWTPILSPITVSYYPNGGTGNVITDTVTANTNYTIRANPFQRTGYNFVNWNTRADGLGVTYNAGQIVRLTASLTLYAQWTTIAKLNVTYYPNGGTGNTITDSVTANTYYTIRANPYLRTGYTFVNWNTRADGLGVTYNAGQSVYLTASLTLYAQWTTIAKLTVTYTPNGGTGSNIIDTVTANTYYTIRANPYSRTGYTFVNWNTRADGLGVTYNAGQSVYLTASLTLYAQWTTVAKLTVTYIPNGGTGSSIVDTVTANTYYIIRTNPYSRTGYSFVNWNTRADGLGVTYNVGQSVYLTASLTLYAQWTTIARLTLTY